MESGRLVAVLVLALGLVSVPLFCLMGEGVEQRVIRSGYYLALDWSNAPVEKHLTPWRLRNAWIYLRCSSSLAQHQADQWECDLVVCFLSSSLRDGVTCALAVA